MGKHYHHETNLNYKDQSGFVRLSSQADDVPAKPNPADIWDSRVDTGSAFYNRLNKYEDEARAIARESLRNEGKFVTQEVREPLLPKDIGSRTAKK